MTERDHHYDKKGSHQYHVEVQTTILRYFLKLLYWQDHYEDDE
jgi:hypothetical protein